MNVFNHFSFRRPLVSLAGLALLLCGSFSTANADIDWGGGATQFHGEDGAALTSQSGVATLISVSEGAMIDFSRYIPEQPEDLLRVGAELREGNNVNRVIAQSTLFYSGYLLYSAIPDLTESELAALGVVGGERLYLVVWDRHTFLDGRPADSSYYTVQSLYNEGVAESEAVVPFSHGSVYAQVSYPASHLTEDQTLLVAERAGHNRFAGFADWAENSFGAQAELDVDALRSLDSDLNGRNNFEEYVLRVVPRLGQPDVDAMSSGIEGDGVLDSDTAAALTRRPQYLVELRADDSTLSYTAHASDDLSEWSSSELYFEAGNWYAAEPQFEITSAEYVGQGVWSLGVNYRSEGADARCFYKMSVSEVSQ